MSEVTTYRLVWGLGSAFVGLSTAVTIRAEQLGPRVMWASDACPDPTQLCGMIPLALPVSVLLAVSFFMVGSRALTALSASNDGGETDA